MNKFLNEIGLCRKAQRLSVGHDAVKQSLKNKKACMVIFSSDASKRLLDEISGIADVDIKIIIAEYDGTDLGLALGKRAVSVISVNDLGFSKKLGVLLSEGNI